MLELLKRSKPQLKSRCPVPSANRTANTLACEPDSPEHGRGSSAHFFSSSLLVSYSASSDFRTRSPGSRPLGWCAGKLGRNSHAIDATRKKATRSNYYTQMDQGLVVLLPVVLQANGKVLHGDALLADRPPAVPRDLYERVQRDLDLRGVPTFATDEIRIEHA